MIRWCNRSPLPDTGRTSWGSETSRLVAKLTAQLRRGENTESPRGHASRRFACACEGAKKGKKTTRKKRLSILFTCMKERKEDAFTCFTHNLMKPQVTSPDTSYIQERENILNMRCSFLFDSKRNVYIIHSWIYWKIKTQAAFDAHFHTLSCIDWKT